MNYNNVSLLATVVKRKDWPDNGLPEIAFVGRSNVGKSSLINMILNRKKLAYVGKTPGKTRTINFYNIDEKLCFVDLPGYGYAVATKGKEAEWASFVNGYLTKRKQLTLVVHLIDSRHKPSRDDIQMNEWLNKANIDYIICLTKTDKLNMSEKQKNIRLIKETLDIQEDKKIIEISSTKRRGKEKLLDTILDIVGIA